MRKTLSQKQIEFGRMVAKLILYAEAIGIPIKVTEWNRDQREQTRLYDSGKSRTLSSQHQIGLAVDIAIIRKGHYITAWAEYRPLGRFWGLLGGTWGGNWQDFNDPFHFQYK